MIHERDLDELARGQHGLVTLSDLERLEIDRDVRRGLVQRGSLTKIGRRTFRMAGAPSTVRQRILAACLDAGGWSTTSTAAWLHGIPGHQPGMKPSVVVERSVRDHRSPLATVRSTTWLPAHDRVVVDGIPCLGVARTLFSLAADATSPAKTKVARAAVDEAVAAGIASDPWLWWRLEQIRCRGRNGVTVFEQILQARSGGLATESWLERETLALLRAAGLPLPVCQERVHRKGAFVARLDFRFPGTRVVLEVSGFRWHRTPDQLRHDLERRRALTLEGFCVLEYSYDDVVASPGRLIAEVTEALGLRSAA